MLPSQPSRLGPPPTPAVALPFTPAVNETMNAEFAARNSEALQTLVRDHGVQIRPYPEDVLRELQRLSAEVLEETARTDAMFRRVLDSLTAYRQTMTPYMNIAERAMLNTRA